MKSWLGDPPCELARKIESTSDTTRSISVFFSGEEGRTYSLKCTISDAYRLNETSYFDAKFADVLLMCAINSQGRLKLIRDQISPYYFRKGVYSLGLMEMHTDFSQDDLSYHLRSDEVHPLLRRCIGACTSSGEWVSVSHDGTYKLGKSLIGEKKVGGAHRDRGPNVIHTIRWISGAAPGICIQCGESRGSCMRSFTDISPSESRA